MAIFLHLNLLLYAVWMSAGSQAPVCEDDDTSACALFLASKPNMCQDQTLSASCQRFCGYCPLTCYDCPDAVGNPTDCTNTTACAVDEDCILRKHTDFDGNIEFVMGCEKKMICQGLNFGFHSLVGRRDLDERYRRDISHHCCDSDLCNLPADFTSTTLPPIKTTTPMPTTTLKPLHNCSRDIVFILDGSTSVGSNNHALLRKFVEEVISHLRIGALDSLVAMVEYSNSARVEWYLNDYKTLTDLQRAARDIPYVTGGTATHAAFWLARNSVLTSRHGARLNAPDVIIFITDGGTDLPGMAINEAKTLHDQGVEIIALGVGSAADDHELDQIKSNFVYKATSYSNLKTFLPSVRANLCM